MGATKERGLCGGVKAAGGMWMCSDPWKIKGCEGLGAAGGLGRCVGLLFVGGGAGCYKGAGCCGGERGAAEETGMLQRKVSVDVWGGAVKVRGVLWT